MPPRSARQSILHTALKKRFAADDIEAQAGCGADLRRGHALEAWVRVRDRGPSFGRA